MQIIRRTEAVQYQGVNKHGVDQRTKYKTSRDPLEVTWTDLPAGLTQDFHVHQTIREATLVIEGQIVAMEMQDGRTKEETLNAGDMVVYGPRTCHTMANRAAARARTLTFKFVGESKDEHLFAKDVVRECSGPIPATPQASSDARFDSYVKAYTSVDTLLWQLPIVVLAGLVFAMGFAADFIASENSAIRGLTHDQTLGVFLGVVGAVLLATGYSMLRLRRHRRSLEAFLGTIEGVGYFADRRGPTRGRGLRSAAGVFIALLFALGLLMSGAAAWLLGWP